MIQTLIPGQAPQSGGQALTDDQIAQLRQYASTLQGSKQPTVQHWLQGVNNVTKDIVGALAQKKADQGSPQRQAELQQYVQPYIQGQAGSPTTPPVYSPVPPAPTQPMAPPSPSLSAISSAPIPPVATTPQPPGPQAAPIVGDFDPSNMSTG